VHINHSTKFRKLVPGRCRYCNRQFFYRRDNRPKLFCDGKCRQADFRHARYLRAKRNESIKKTEAKAKTFGPDFADRPLNVLGGYKWYSGLERRLWVEITAPAEDFRRSNWNPTHVLPARRDDLNLDIPPFLRRAAP
jgi:hypothetical protein